MFKGVAYADVPHFAGKHIELVHSDKARAPLGREIYALVGPDGLTGGELTLSYRDFARDAVAPWARF